MTVAPSVNEIRRVTSVCPPPPSSTSIRRSPLVSGSDASNLKLSEGRAAAVKKHFIKKGVPATRLSSKGFGEAQPIADNKTVAGRGKNRRVVLMVIRDVETTVPAPQPVPATPAPAAPATPLMKP